MTDLPRYLQLMWDREPPGRRGPRPTMSIRQIGEAGVAIADAEGLAAVSMKRVAESLGFTTMSLYRYVDSKEQLAAVMYDVALGPADLAYGRKGWRARMSLWAKGIAERRLAHPWTLDLAQPAPPLTPNLLAWTEAGLAALERTPLTGQQKLSALLAVDGWAAQHVRQSWQMGFLGELEPDGPQAAYPRHIVTLVDADRFPHLAAASRDAFGEDSEDFFVQEFAYGLELLLDGIAVRVAGTSTRDP